MKRIRSRTTAILIVLLLAVSTSIEVTSAAPTDISESTIAHLKNLRALEKRLTLQSASPRALQRLRGEIARIETTYGLPHDPTPKKEESHQQEENTFDLAYKFAMKKPSEGGLGYVPVDAQGWAAQQFKHTDHNILLKWMKQRQLQAAQKAYAEAWVVECVKKNIDLWAD